MGGATVTSVERRDPPAASCLVEPLCMASAGCCLLIGTATTHSPHSHLTRESVAPLQLQPSAEEVLAAGGRSKVKTSTCCLLQFESGAATARWAACLHEAATLGQRLEQLRGERDDAADRAALMQVSAALSPLN
eukprot:COSAG01_NODE_10785_length_2081_cov_0.830474_1_plen_134_part_00